MVLQPNFYLLCIVCLQRLQEGNSQRLQFRSSMRGKANNVHFPCMVYHLDIAQMRTVTIQCQDNGIFLDSFIKQTKCLNHYVQLPFWIHAALWQAAIKPGGALSRSSAFMLLSGNTRRGGTYIMVAFMQVTIVTSEPPVCWRQRDPSLTLKEGNLAYFKTVGQHWFPNKSHIDQFLYICVLAINFIFECRSQYFKQIWCFFNTKSSLQMANGIHRFHFVPYITLSSVHLQCRIQSH